MLGQVRLDAVQEQRGLVEQAVRRAHVLDDDGLGHALELRLLLLRQLAAGVDHDGDVIDVQLVLQAVDELEAVHVR